MEEAQVPFFKARTNSTAPKVSNGFMALSSFLEPGIIMNFTLGTLENSKEETLYIAHFSVVILIHSGAKQ